MKPMIQIENATKKFKDRVVFQNVNITINPGESVGFVGHNGCGKSVLLKSVCGFSLLTKGEIKCQGEVIGKDRDFIKDAGVVIETPEFINDLSGYKNLKIIADILKKIREKEINTVLKILNLSKDKDKKVGKYSLGMKQKLRLAQAMMESPKILILDEPTNGLDKEGIEIVYKILRNFRERGGTLLLASHNPRDIEYLCDHVYEYENHNFILKQ